jgi:hypothetical protein
MSDEARLSWKKAIISKSGRFLAAPDPAHAAAWAGPPRGFHSGRPDASAAGPWWPADIRERDGNGLPAMPTRVPVVAGSAILAWFTELQAGGRAAW